MQYIAGHERVQRRLTAARSAATERIATALETSGTRVKKAAQWNHPKLYRGTHPGPEGIAAIKAFHEATGRFTTRTGELMLSIDRDDAVIDGINGTITVDVTASAEYAEKVEMQFPYLRPALFGNEAKIKDDVRRALTGGL